MELSVIMVSSGIPEWEDFTLPAISSMEKHTTRKYEFIVTDNAGQGRGNVNTDVMLPYSVMVNKAAQLATGDRLLILNNDITATGDWYRCVEQHTSFPYCGPVLLSKEGVTYVEGWCISIERDLFHMLNGLCEKYKNSWDDVDFAWRLSRLGVPASHIPMPMKHIWGATRHRYTHSNDWDEENRQYMLSRIRGTKYKWNLSYFSGT